MNYKVYLLSLIIGTGETGDAFRPQLSDDYPAIGWTDDTGRDVADLPGVPDCIVVLARCDDGQLAALEADENYCVLSVEEDDEITP